MLCQQNLPPSPPPPPLPPPSPLQVVRLHQLLHEARFDEPNGDHLSPAGEYNLRLGVMKELRPELIATHQGEDGGRGGAPELIATHQGEERRERGGLHLS